MCIRDRSAAPANIVIIADTDMLMDYMWVQTRESVSYTHLDVYKRQAAQQAGRQPRARIACRKKTTI